MKPPEPPRKNGKTPLEKMTDLTRRIVSVPKTELRKKPKGKRRGKH